MTIDRQSVFDSNMAMPDSNGVFRTFSKNLTTASNKSRLSFSVDSLLSRKQKTTVEDEDDEDYKDNDRLEILDGLFFFWRVETSFVFFESLYCMSTANAKGFKRLRQIFFP